jgi:hypothetical protein
MESRGPQFQKQLSHIEALIYALNGAADPTLAAKSRELTQALLKLRGAGLERVFELIHGSELTGQALIHQQI